MLRFAHENGCSWGKRTCEEAARERNLECLRYATMAVPSKPGDRVS